MVLATPEETKANIETIDVFVSYAEVITPVGAEMKTF